MRSHTSGLVRSRRAAAMSRGAPLCLVLLSLSGCAPEPDPGEEIAEPPAPATSRIPATPDEGELVFDREFAFLPFDVESRIIVSWFFRSRVTAAGVHQELTASLAQDGEWAVLAEETADARATRSPWRILPGSTVRLLVGPEDRVESLLLRTPPREFETVLGNLVTEWADPGNETVRVYQGHTIFPAGPVEGLVIEISRRWEPDAGSVPGDWVFLHSGPTLQFFMEGEGRSEDLQTPIPYQGWSRRSFRDVVWPDLEVRWMEVRAFEPARRNVPVRWQLATRGSEVSGTWESVSSHLTAGPSEGPILPLLGLFEVSGTLEIQGEELPVVGLIRHVQR